MKLKLEFTEKERRVLYRILAVVLSITFMATGMYAISYFEKIGLIQGKWQIAHVLGLHVLQWWLVMRVVFKHYR